MTEKNREGEGMTYDGSGVDYRGMDPFKRMAQLAGRETAGGLGRFGFSEVEWSRGESCYLIDIGDACLGHVEEGLGTKNLIAEAVYVKTGKSHYAEIGQDAVAMIVNDLITLGALPVSVAMHLAVANASWFENETRCRDLVTGWKKACLCAGCVWGCGETPTLRDIVAQGGDVEKTVTAGKDGRGKGMVVNSSRGIIFASSGGDFAEAARRETQKLHDLINQYR